MQVTVHIEDTGEDYACQPGESLLAAMVRLGRRGIPVGCRGGGCGVCKVEITGGQVATAVMSRDHVSAEEEARGCLLACRAFPVSDVSLRVLGRMHRFVCRPGAPATQV